MIKQTKLDAIGVRFNGKERAALEKAAMADDRQLSPMIRKLVVDALKVLGFLK